MGVGAGRGHLAQEVHSPATCPVSPQRMVLEQAAQGSSPPDIRMQYLHQIQANHEVRPQTSH